MKLSHPAVFVVASVSMFLLSLAFDVSHFSNVDHSALMVLMLGWMGPFALQVGWYANPLLWLSWIMLLAAKKRGALTANVFIAGFALALALTSYPSIAFGSMVGPNEGSMARDFEGFGPAIFLWTASVVFCFVGAVVRFRQRPPAAEPRGRG